jgi:hypothetical protein
MAPLSRKARCMEAPRPTPSRQGGVLSPTNSRTRKTRSPSRSGKPCSIFGPWHATIVRFTKLQLKTNVILEGRSKSEARTPSGRDGPASRYFGLGKSLMMRSCFCSRVAL